MLLAIQNKIEGTYIMDGPNYNRGVVRAAQAEFERQFPTPALQAAEEARQDAVRAAQAAARRAAAAAAGRNKVGGSRRRSRRGGRVTRRHRASRRVTRRHHKRR